MCYDISFRVDVRELADYYPGLVFDEQMQIDFNHSVHIQGHSFNAHPIIYKTKSDQNPHCRAMEWGCIPFYVKDEMTYKGQRTSMLNARSERIFDPKSYWYKIRTNRCLIPVTGIYEHREIKGWQKKAPYFIKLKSQRIFYIPCLYSIAKLPDLETGEILNRWTFALMTTAANEVMRQIHNSGENKGRMPLFLRLEQSQEFINPGISDDRYKEILSFEMPAEELDYHPVFTIRSPKPRPDEKEKDEIYEWPNLPELGSDGSSKEGSLF